MADDSNKFIKELAKLCEKYEMVAGLHGVDIIIHRKNSSQQHDRDMYVNLIHYLKCYQS